MREPFNDYQKSKEVLKQPVALNYQSYLSRRKSNLVCKTQSSFFNVEREVWLPRNIKCLRFDLRLPKLSFSADNVEKFVKSLDIGHVTQILGVSGVSCTITGLVSMIIDLQMRVPHLSRNLSGSMKTKIIVWKWGLPVPPPLCKCKRERSNNA